MQLLEGWKCGNEAVRPRTATDVEDGGGRLWSSISLNTSAAETTSQQMMAADDRANTEKTPRASPPQHLSTFIMDKAESIVTVDDAIKKLALLDSKDKIWTQEVLLQVTDKAVRLLDCDTQVRLQTRRANAKLAAGRLTPSLPQDELENFPLSTIHLSQTVLNQMRYPSVLLLVCQDKDQHKPDIHFFHCDEVDVSFPSENGRRLRLHPRPL